ncbi:hypothetical protein DDR33_21620 [Pararcticibacter amylolyticus]|uniref:Adenylosuccinate lyase n=2 Tax=Pararcticibacter amylolyticus TaxID=2173175 RepID=A0A2U2PB86_9SPHI|nr:hypothetical protein DDR33_21620 [Pararcticibacter amylolyticus]
MTKDQLIQQLKASLTKRGSQRIADICVSEPALMHELLLLSFHHEPEIAFRAAWVLETSALQYPEGFRQNIPVFLQRYGDQSNNSCQRHFSKIMMHLLKTNAIPEPFDYAAIIEPTFVWLADEQIPVAVKANCMSILFMLRKKEDWIGEELRAQIEFLMKDGTAAIQSRGKKILHKLAAK